MIVTVQRTAWSFFLFPKSRGADKLPRKSYSSYNERLTTNAVMSQYILVAAIIIIAAVWIIWSRRSNRSGNGGAFNDFVRDLTADAAAGKLEKVTGRDEEIERLIHIIMRRSKNNPLLIGEPGVGKTAIVEGLAKRIVEKRVPEALIGKKILALNLGDILSGTALRGELEARVRSLMSRLENMQREAIVFIDELHMISQAKGVEGGLNFSDMIKPALARGEVAIIGATTWTDYNQTLRLDPAIERRFQPLLVGEPSRKETIDILNGLKGDYEKFHGVIINDDAIVAAVDLSRELIKNRFLPDKAIDLMDEASAKVAIEASRGHGVPMGIIHHASKKAIERLKKESMKLQTEKDHLTALNKNFPHDAALMNAAHDVDSHLKELTDESAKLAKKKYAVPTVTVKDVAAVTREWQRFARAYEQKK